MRAGAQILLGFLAAVLSALIVFGAMATALVEGGVQTALQPATDTAQPAAPISQPGGFTPAAVSSPFPTATYVPPTSCPPPAGWIPVTVGLDESLPALADAHQTSVQQIVDANCLVVPSIRAGSVVYVPPAPPTATTAASPTLEPARTSLPTRTSIPCGPPAGWVRYRVQAGDTLSRLSRLLGGVSISQLQQANCLGSSDLIRGGSFLWVPFLPATRTPALPAPVITTTMLPSPTWTQAPPTSTPAPPTPTLAPDTATNTPPPPTMTTPPETATNTPLPPTETQVPPTDTTAPPSGTPVTPPATGTLPAPTETSVTLSPPEVTIVAPTTPPVQE